METHSDTTGKRQGPKVSPAGLAAALAVFAVAIFAFGSAGLRNEEPEQGVISSSVPAAASKPAAAVLDRGKVAQKHAPAGNEQTSSQKIDKKKQAADAPRQARRKPAEVRRADAVKTTKPERRAAAPAAAPTERYDVIPLKPGRPAQPQGGAKVPPSAKLPGSGQKIPDTVVKVDAPPPASGKETAPQWYTVKLKPVPSKTLADATASGLRQRGFVESQTVQGPNGTYFVKIGGYGFRNAAEDAKKQLGALGFTDAHIEEKTVAK